jgi:hypothetical protein
MSAVLEPDEIQRLTGYRRPADQLAELLRQGLENRLLPGGQKFDSLNAAIRAAMAAEKGAL